MKKDVKNLLRVLKHIVISGISIVCGYDSIRILNGENGIFHSTTSGFSKLNDSILCIIILVSIVLCIPSILNLLFYLAGNGELPEKDPISVWNILYGITIGAAYAMSDGIQNSHTSDYSSDKFNEAEFRKAVKESLVEMDKYNTSSQHQFYENLRNRYKK